MSSFSVAGVKPPTIDYSQSENYQPSLNSHHGASKEFITSDEEPEPKEHCVELDQTIDVPKSYLCPVSPMYSSDYSERETNSEFCKYSPSYSDTEREK